MELITGVSATDHIDSQDDADFQKAITGPDNYVLNIGRKMEAELLSNNVVRVHDGSLIHQGRHVIIPEGESEEVIIEYGTQGEKRIDLIVSVYSKDTTSGIETEFLKSIKGTPSVDSPAIPSHIDGNIRAGDIYSEFPLYKVTLDGINIVSIDPLYEVLTSMAELKTMTDELNRKLPVFKRRNSSEAGICTPHYIMIMGTLVLQGANADYRQLFSASDLLSKILKFYDPSISNFDEGKCVITTNNGDGNAAAIHFYAPEWWGSNNAYYQYFYPGTSSTIRVNYCIHYLKL
ncbi:hypothetical protein [[Clostridium] scindens]|uniref:hypothetical protein n=1 Tax=Clostridium scindens (strain JCM 10418 / VPI 12708) TaxID=29347 RepID=UPI00298CE3CB|nr:hypothetical protein [[Clostridium] scindens]WPB41316.1 hypothetical protein DEGADCKI_02655 [[Clostridium] scindens]